jgi:hypothetical protein
MAEICLYVAEIPLISRVPSIFQANIFLMYQISSSHACLTIVLLILILSSRLIWFLSAFLSFQNHSAYL